MTEIIKELINILKEQVEETRPKCIEIINKRPFGKSEFESVNNQIDNLCIKYGRLKSIALTMKSHDILIDIQNIGRNISSLVDVLEPIMKMYAENHVDIEDNEINNEYPEDHYDISVRNELNNKFNEN